MGGFPTLLLMIAAAGVTYGWQPDENGDDADAVEYTVQISPAELAQMQRSGELSHAGFSSVIDPEVRGHVSKIVVRVGTGDLPRETPSALTRRRIATLKPAPQAGDGFGLPASLQNAANETANNFGQQAIDQAGRAIQNGTNQAKQKANNLLDRLRGNEAGRSLVPPPPTRGTPSFTGQGSADTANTFARPRTGGPSTAPATRDNQWSRYAAENQNRPSTTPTASSPFATSQANQKSFNSFGRGNEATLASNGLRTSDTFGKLPSDLVRSDLNRSDDRSASNNGGYRTNGSSAANTSADGIFSQIDQTKRDFQISGRGDAQDSLRSAATGYGQRQSNDPSTWATQQDPQSRDLSSQYANTQSSDSRSAAYAATPRPNTQLTREQLAAGGWDFDAYHRLIDRNGQLIRETSNGTRSPYGYDAQGRPNANTTSNSALANSTGRYPYGDPRNEFVDRTGQLTNGLGRANTSRSGLDNSAINSPLNRNGNVDQWGRPLTNQNLTNDNASVGYSRNSPSDARYQNSGYQDQNSADRSRNPSLINDSRYDGRDDRTASMNYSQQNNVRQTNRSTQSAQAPQQYQNANQWQSGMVTSLDSQPSLASPSDQTQHPAQDSRAALARKKPVAAQPLFNGLLLISFVANIYLMFWLKNLRVQFKDMVTAKRLAKTTASVSA